MGPGWDFLSAQLITLFKGFQKLGVAKFIYVVPWTYWKHRLRGAGAGGNALSPSSWFHMPTKPHTVYVCQTAAQTIKTWKSFALGWGDSSFIWSHLTAHVNSGLWLGVSGWKIQGNESFNGCGWFRKLSKHGEFIIITLKQVSWDYPGGPVLRPHASNAGGTGLISGQGTKILHASQFGKKTPPKTKKKNQVWWWKDWAIMDGLEWQWSSQLQPPDPPSFWPQSQPMSREAGCDPGSFWT